MTMRNRIPALWIASLAVMALAVVLWWQFRPDQQATSVSTGVNQAALQAARERAMKAEVPKNSGPLLSVATTTLRNFGTNAPSVAADPKFPYRLRNTEEPMERLVRNDKAILMANALIDTTSKARLEIPDHLKAKGDPGSYIVQARGNITDLFRQQLSAAGAEIIAYIPNNAYLVKIDSGGAAKLARMSLTRSVLPYEPYYKLQEQLLPFAVGDAPVPMAYNLRLTFFPGQELEATKTKLEKLGATIIGEDRSPFGPQLIVQPGRDSLAALANLKEIQTIERKSSRVVMNDLSRVRVGISTNTITSSTYRDLTGNNILVNINDSNVDTNYPGLAGRVYVGLNTSPIDTIGHGTHVAGTIAGDGSNSPNITGTLFGSVAGADFKGMAPASKLLSQNYLGLPDALLAEYAASTNLLLNLKTNTLISNNSWGYDNSFEYDSASAIYDAATRDAIPEISGSQPVLFVFSVGNSGFGDDGGLGGLPNSVSSPAAAKNVIAVGASELLRFITNEVQVVDPFSGTTNIVAYWRGATDSSNEVASFSGRGNTGIGREGLYGRAKPDLVAPGTMLISAASTNMDLTNYYSLVTITTNRFTNIVFSALQTNSFSLFVPDNTTNLTIQILDNSSGLIVPCLFYTNQLASLPSTNILFYAGTNVFTTPIDPTSYGLWYYDVVNTNNAAVTVEIREIITQTNNLGNYPLVLSNMNKQIGPFYRFEIGTSMSAPVVSGMLALMQEFFERDLAVTNASPALYKALLINGARSLSATYGHEVKNNINYQGWGLVNISNSLPLTLTQATTNTTAPLHFFDQSPTNALMTGEAHMRNLTMTPAAQAYPLRVTLVWTDPPGNPAAGIKLVNDLDLVVSNKVTGEIFYGNDFPAGTVYSVGNASDTNAVSDVVNNVENVFLPGNLDTDYAIYVIANRVNVNAVNDHPNGVVQDYALVVSSGNILLTSAFTLDQVPTLLSQPKPKVKYFTNSTNGIPLMGERVGANPPLITTTNGTNTQWNFYVLTNDSGFTNVTFVTFLPPNLSGNPANNTYRAPSADIDLYVSTSSDLTNLTTAVVADCFLNTIYASPAAGGAVSAGRTGTEAILITNAPANQIYYIGVKSEDQKGADFGFLAVASLDSPFNQDNDGHAHALFVPVPALIPDGSPELPGAVQMIAVVPQTLQIRRILVTNTVTHELFGDIIGSLEHNDVVVTLNNHTFFDANQQSGTFTTIYDDSGQNDIVGSRITDGPGTLQSYVGSDAVGAWVFTMIDNSPQFVGQIESMSLGIDLQTTNSSGGDIIPSGTTVTLQDGSSLYGAIDVPPGVVGVTFNITSVPNGPTTGLYIKKGAFPDAVTGNYDYSKVGSTPLTNRISVADVPPLTPGRYFVQLRNESGGPVTYDRFSYVFEYDLAATVGVVQQTNSYTQLIDNALLRTNRAEVTVNTVNNDLVAGVRVGVRIDHPQASDLVLRLTHVGSGISTLLSENRGGTVNTNGYGLGTNASEIVYTSFSEDPLRAHQLMKFADPSNSFVPFVTPSLVTSAILVDSNSPPKLVGSSGTGREFTRTIPTGQTAGKVVVHYMFYTAPDKLDVYYEGAILPGGTTGSDFNNFVTVAAGNTDPITDTFTLAGHGFVDGDEVTITGGLPTGINSRQRYFIVNSTLNTFQVSITSGGPAVDLLDGGVGNLNIYQWKQVGPINYSGASDLITIVVNNGVIPAPGTLWDYVIEIQDAGGAVVNNLQPLANQKVTGVVINNTNLYLVGITEANATNGVYARFSLPLQTNQLAAESVNWPSDAGGTRFNGIAYITNGLYVAGDSYARSSDTTPPKETKGVAVSFHASALTNSAGENLGSRWDTNITSAASEGAEEMRGVTTTFETGTAYTYMVGNAAGVNSPSRLKVAKLDTSGVIQWVVDDDIGALFTTTSGHGVTVLNGNIFVAGVSDDAGVARPMMVKYLNDGTEVTRVTLAGANPGQFNAVVSSGGFLYAVGSEDALTGSAANFLVVKYDENLNEIWAAPFTLDLGDEDVLYGVAAVGDRLYAVGSSVQGTTGLDGVIIELLQANGTLITRPASGYPGYTLYDHTLVNNGVTSALNDAFRAVAFDGSDLYVVGDVTQLGNTQTDGIVLRYHVKDDYYPEESLDQFVNDTANGIWRLEVDDVRAGNGTGGVMPQILSWNLQLFLSDTNPASLRLDNGQTYLGSIRGGRTNFFVINAPYTATAATHDLNITASSGAGNGLQLWFDQVTFPTGGSVLLTNITTTGQKVMTTGGTPQLVPGQRYFLAIYNPDVGVDYDYNLTVTFDSSATTYMQAGTAIAGNFGNLPNTQLAYQFLIPAADDSGTLELLNLTGDVEVTLRHGAAPANGVFDIQQTLHASAKASIPLVPSGTVTDVSGTWFVTVRKLTTAATSYQIRIMPPNHAPTLAAISNATVAEGSDLFVQLSGTDNDILETTLTYSLSAGVPAGMTVDAQTGLIHWQPTEAQGPGTYTVTARVTDDGAPVMYAERSFTVTVTEVNTAPTLPALTGTLTATEGVLFTTTLPANDTDLPANTLTFSRVNGPTGLTISAGGVVSWTPGETDGGHTVSFTARVSDGALNTTRIYDIVVNEANSAPVIADIPTKNVNELTLLAFDVSATDSDIPAQTLTYRFVGTVPSGMQIVGSTGHVTWTPTEAQGPGTYQVTVEAQDNGSPSMSAQKTFTVVVAEVNTSPVVTFIENTNIFELQPWTYQVVATDSDLPANTLTYSLFQPPFGMTISSTGLISWTPTEAQGPSTNSVTVVVKDNGTPQMSGTRTFTVTVKETNAAPVLNVITDVSVDEQTLLIVHPVATDSDIPAQTLTYRLTGSTPAGLTITASTGEIRWTPSEAQGPGVYPITVEVSDGTLTASRTFNITVNEVNNAPVLGVIPNVTVIEGKAVRFVATATDSDVPAQTLAFSLVSGAPAGATINAATGAFEWLTDEASPNSNTITVKVTDSGTPPLSATRSFTITVTEVVTNVVNLVSGTAVTNTTRYADGIIADIYKLTVSGQPSKILFEAFNLTGNGDLLVKKGAYPTATAFDYSSVLAGTNHEQVVISTNASLLDLSGDWYATVVNHETNNITYSISGTVPVAVTGGTILTSTEGIKVASPAINTSAETAQFTWSAVPGEKYQVEASTNLIDWTVVTSIVVSGPTATFTDPTPYNDLQQRFYRIRQVPQ